MTAGLSRRWSTSLLGALCACPKTSASGGWCMTHHAAPRGRPVRSAATTAASGESGRRPTTAGSSAEGNGRPSSTHALRAISIRNGWSSGPARRNVYRIGSPLTGKDDRSSPCVKESRPGECRCFRERGRPAPFSQEATHAVPVPGLVLTLHATEPGRASAARRDEFHIKPLVERK
jgi:hypothetical protein